jgi:hypothetical protein
MGYCLGLRTDKHKFTSKEGKKERKKERKKENSACNRSSESESFKKCQVLY